MALLSIRLRRALTTVSSFNRCLSISPSAAPKPDNPSSPFLLKHAALVRRSEAEQSGTAAQWAGASARLYSTKQYKLYKEGDEITPDTVLFEGCDYNHWLITMDFPKDNPPSPQDMIATYEQTCAKGLGISLEEAKKRMYACSTTTYQGFQAIMTEEESEKFRDIPGVVFILPDSYIDPVNKEYGGDKYENGVITPRPPPVQYGRSRPRERIRNTGQPRFDRQGGPPQNYQGNPQYQQQGSMQGDGRGYVPQQNYPPQQNYGPPGQHGEGRAPMPPYQGNYNQGGHGSQVPPPYQGSHNQVPQGNYNQGGQGSYNRQAGGGNYAPPTQGGNYAPPTQGGNYEQAGNPGYTQGYPGHGQRQPSPQADQRNVAGDWRNSNPMGQTGTDQGKY